METRGIDANIYLEQASGLQHAMDLLRNGRV